MEHRVKSLTRENCCGMKFRFGVRLINIDARWPLVNQSTAGQDERCKSSYSQNQIATGESGDSERRSAAAAALVKEAAWQVQHH